MNNSRIIFVVLFAAFATMAGAEARAASANLSVKVVPAAGCLSGSYCPMIPGVTWTNVIDEQMSKGHLSNLWSPTGRCGPAIACVVQGNTWVDNRRALSWTSCCAVISWWNAVGAPGNTNNYPGAGEISTYAAYGYGYYEIKEVPGTTWSAFWIPDNNGGCPPNFANGAELDIQENYLGTRLQTNIIYGDYTSCPQMLPHTLYGTDPNAVNVYGMDWSPTRGVTYYLNGMQTYHIDPPAPAPQSFGVILASAGYVQGDPPNNPMQIYWIRYYKINPQ